MLHLFEKDTNRRGARCRPCAKCWPPLLTNGKPVACARSKQLLLGMTGRANGKCQGAGAFGTGWDALSAAGTKDEAGG